MTCVDFAVTALPTSPTPLPSSLYTLHNALDLYTVAEITRRSHAGNMMEHYQLPYDYSLFSDGVMMSGAATVHVIMSDRFQNAMDEGLGHDFPEAEHFSCQRISPSRCSFPYQDMLSNRSS